MNEIAILSGKGGTGKTSLCAAFSYLEKQVVVADCDVDAANLHLVLQPQNTHSEYFLTGFGAKIDYEKCAHCGICMDHCRFDAISMVNGVVIISETSCDGCKLCSRVCPSQAITMEPKQNSQWFIGEISNGTMVHARLAPGEENSGKLVNVVRDWAKKKAQELGIDTIIIDGPPGTGCPVISSVTGVNKVVLVTEPTRSGFHDLERIVELVNQFKITPDVVINKFDLNRDMSTRIANWCTKHGIRVIGKLPFDEKIVEAMLQNKSIVEWGPNSSISNEIVHIWSQVNH